MASSQEQSVTSSSGGADPEQRRSLLSQAVDKAKAKLVRRPDGTVSLPNDEKDFERRRTKETEKQKRKEEYESLGLGERTKFGMKGAGGWTAG